MALYACMDRPLSLWERAGVRAPFTVKPPVEKAAPFSTLLRCRASTMEPSQPNLRVESPLSLLERAGVRAPFTVKPLVEKAAPFSTLRHRWASTVELSQPNLRVAWIAPSPCGRGLGLGCASLRNPSGKGCAVFHATVLLGFDDGAVSTQPTRCMDRPLSLRERAGVRARFAVKPQWKRLRRFPRYGAIGLRRWTRLNPTYALKAPSPCGRGLG